MASCRSTDHAHPHGLLAVAQVADTEMVQPLSTSPTLLCSSILPTPPSQTHLLQWYWKLQLVTAYIFGPHSSTGKYSMARIIGLAQGLCSLKHHTYQTITETSLTTATLQVFNFGTNDMLLDLFLQP